MRPSAISPCHFDHISVSLLVPFRWSDIPATRLLDSKRVNPESKGLTRFNPESTHGLNVVNPESTPALTASTPGLAGQPRPPSQKCERPQPETSGCGDHINTIAKKRRIVKRNLQQCQTTFKMSPFLPRLKCPLFQSLASSLVLCRRLRSGAEPVGRSGGRSR